MKSVTPELQALLNSGRFTQADLYTLTLTGGATVRHTAMPGMAVLWAGHTFNDDGIRLERGAINSKLHTDGLEVDNVEITLRFTGADTLAGAPVAAYARNGGLDGARLLIQKAFCAVDSAGNTNPYATGVIFLFEGRLSEPKIGRMNIELALVADTEKLKAMAPRNTINLNCMNTHYDSACGLNKAAYTQAGTVTGGTKSAITAAMAQAAGYFTLGSIVFSTGQNAGATRTVKWFNGSQFSLAHPLDYTPQAGDTFEATAGCDLTEAVCLARFNNTANRRCFKHVPPYEENL